MRRKAEHPIAKEKLLDAAQTLVMEKGFVAASVEDICRKARLTKGSFFHYFEDKDELGKELLKRYCSGSQAAMRSCWCDSEKDPKKRVEAILDFVAESAKTRGTAGCLMGTMAQELSETKPEIRAICARGFEELAGLFERELKAAKARYAPRAAWDPKSVADYFVTVLQGSALLGRVRQDPSVAKNSVRHFRRYIETLLGN